MGAAVGRGGRRVISGEEANERLERELIARLRRRDEAAFNQLVRLHQDRVYRLLLRMCGDPAEAEDLAQEVFVMVFKSIDSFRGDAKLSTWIFRIAANQSKNRIKYHRRRSQDGQRSLDETLEGQADASVSTGSRVHRPDEWAEGRQAENFMQQALAALDEEQRVLVVLRDIENLSYDEVQRVTGLAEGTVKSKLHRARAALSTHFENLQQGRMKRSTGS